MPSCSTGIVREGARGVKHRAGGNPRGKELSLKGRASRHDVVDQIAMRIEDHQTVNLYQVLLNR